MGKAKKETTLKKTPYTHKKNTKDTIKKPVVKSKKPLTKSEKLKNVDITENLDSLMNDLTQHLTPKKKKRIQIKNDNMDESSKIEEDQRKYEQTQNDMEAALGLLNKL